MAKHFLSEYYVLHEYSGIKVNYPEAKNFLVKSPQIPIQVIYALRLEWLSIWKIKVSADPSAETSSWSQPKN